MDRWPALALATVAMLLAGCDEPSTNADPAASPTGATTSAPAPAAPARPPTAAPGADDPLVVIAHATRPQLRLTAQQAADLVARRGTAGVARSVRAVERDPAAVGVVPLSEVGPTVRGRRGGGRGPGPRPRGRDHAGGDR